MGRDAWRLQDGGGWWLTVVRTAPSCACEVGVSGTLELPAGRLYMPIVGPEPKPVPGPALGGSSPWPVHLAADPLHCVSTCPSGKQPWGPVPALTCCSSVSWANSWWALYSVRKQGPFTLALA